MPIPTTKTAKPSPVKIGTLFNAQYADGCPQWRVVAARGQRTWDCVIQGPDYAGTSKVFGTEEIQRSLALNAYFADSKKSQDQFYAALQPGQVVHYRDGSESWIRCQAQRGTKGRMVLVPVAMVGKWSSHALNKYTRTGKVYEGYWPKSIREGLEITPHHGNLEEVRHPEDSKKVAALPPLDYSPAPMTAEKQAQVTAWTALEAVQKILESTQDQDPSDLLQKIRLAIG